MVVTDKIARKHVIVKTREVVTISQEHAIVHPDGGVQCKYLFIHMKSGEITLKPFQISFSFYL